MEKASGTKIKNDCFVDSRSGHNICETKFCKGCNQLLQIDDFGIKKTENNRRESRCKKCKSKRAIENRKKCEAKEEKQQKSYKSRAKRAGLIDFSKEIKIEINMEVQEENWIWMLQDKIGEMIWLEEKKRR